MANMLEKIELNLGYLVLANLVKDKVTKQDKSAHLPYANFIMLILEAYDIFVPSTPEFSSVFSCLEKDHIVVNIRIELNAQGQLEYRGTKRKAKSHVVSEGSDGDEEEEEEEEMNDNEFDPMDIDQLGVRMLDLQVSVNGVRTRVDEVYTRMDGIEVAIGTQNSNFDVLQSRLDTMDAYQRSMFEDILRRLPPPPPQ